MNRLWFLVPPSQNRLSPVLRVTCPRRLVSSSAGQDNNLSLWVSQPPNTKLSGAESRKLYRTFLRAGSKAVVGTNRQRKQIWQWTRTKFDKNLTETDPEKLGDLWIRSQNTLAFLKIASQRKGLEHKIVRNLCDFQFYQNRFNERPNILRRNIPSDISYMHAHCMDDLDLVIEMLNQELDLCL
ncbi:hypothetical protein J3Q64DRAFT_1833445 [Phycomyces blakesleeanus]|uniref:Complex 1 LYR protein domain-containing protein n=2 Tax=Phycomyces blakesleeanus TaxID=4837 RepID=A0A167KBK6_PHYB8|nr:hypothetical protein PHYBLDRAFT_151217 [Phycomyces blakesleeanus NRRL 1555(-)]OAD67695.1 hypothetical protein PHYBLDRAFT_151217 [Phycomyces blakesleeanus NRRL 1555(-)]|eukprot:XP_018285735.1 hypothetical protein PHYBLDRAFT_151217 [Phycomyces blakesleeanus NRRL 1555(-)]